MPFITPNSILTLIEELPHGLRVNLNLTDNNIVPIPGGVRFVNVTAPFTDNSHTTLELTETIKGRVNLLAASLSPRQMRPQLVQKKMDMSPRDVKATLDNWF